MFTHNNVGPARGIPVQRTTLGSERSSLPRFLTAVTAGILLAALPVLAKTPPKTKAKPAAVQTAIIENTGSTNTTGYQIRVASNGSAAVLIMPALTSAVAGLPAVHYNSGTVKDASKFFQDLSAAAPLASLPVRHGMRSASFGTQTFITYKGQRSPDLTFASDPRTVALKADIDSITKALHVGNAPRHPIAIQPIVIHANK